MYPTVDAVQIVLGLKKNNENVSQNTMLDVIDNMDFEHIDGMIRNSCIH